MDYLLAFLVCGTICTIGQIIYDNTKFAPGHITALFVVIGTILDTFNIYDKLVEFSKVGASLPITSFGHSLMHAADASMHEMGILGVAAGIFDISAAGITSAILFAFLVAVIFKPKS